MPRFVIFVRSNWYSESDQKPTAEVLETMANYKASMIDAGVLQYDDGLHPSSQTSRRIIFHGDEAPTVEPGPFPSHELVAGWWILKVKDVDEAVAWAKKCPFKGGSVEVRTIADLADFGEAYTPELRKKDEEMRKQLQKLAIGE